MNQSKPKPKSKPATAKPKSSFPEADRFMKSPVMLYLSNHRDIVTFDDLLKSIVQEIETSVKADPAKYNLTEEQIKTMNGGK